MAKLGFIGTGEIAAPTARNLAEKGHHITVTRRSKVTSAALVASHGVTVADPADVVATADIVFLCVRPHQAEGALTGLPWRADHQIVSVMAAVPQAKLHELCAPARDFVQTIPLAYLEQGGCPLAAFGNTGLLVELFAPENPVIAVASEDALNAHFAICAMLPGILDLMQSGAGWLGTQTGDAQASEAYTAQLISGFLNSKRGTLAAERDALATAGTLSLQMTEGLRKGGAHTALTQTLAAIGDRLKGA